MMSRFAVRSDQERKYITVKPVYHQRPDLVRDQRHFDRSSNWLISFGMDSWNLANQ